MQLADGGRGRWSELGIQAQSHGRGVGALDGKWLWAHVLAWSAQPLPLVPLEAASSCVCQPTCVYACACVDSNQESVRPSIRLPLLVY